MIRCRQSAIARQVKLADLRDNTRLERTILRPHRIADDLRRVHQYLLSYKFLTDGLTESEYRALMAAHG
ncbi:MAG TPA: hypothetical protein VML55_00440 [Planctomycetaceae bacterium]|nr:hypothetical protein [Planctomycetaceae bacterium]